MFQLAKQPFSQLLTLGKQHHTLATAHCPCLPPQPIHCYIQKGRLGSGFQCSHHGHDTSVAIDTIRLLVALNSSLDLGHFNIGMVCSRSEFTSLTSSSTTDSLLASALSFALLPSVFRFRTAPWTGPWLLAPPTSPPSAASC